MLIRSNAGLLRLIIISHNIWRFFSGAISQPAIEPMLSECCQSFSSLLTHKLLHMRRRQLISYDFFISPRYSVYIHLLVIVSKSPESKGEISIGDLCLGIFRQNLVTISSQILCESFNNLVFFIDVDIFSIRKKIVLEQNCLVYLEDSNLDSPLLLNTGFWKT